MMHRNKGYSGKGVKDICERRRSATAGVYVDTDLLVPTLWLGAMSMVSVAES